MNRTTKIVLWSPTVGYFCHTYMNGGDYFHSKDHPHKAVGWASINSALDMKKELEVNPKDYFHPKYADHQKHPCPTDWEVHELHIELGAKLA